jgi:hypothetical protein
MPHDTDAFATRRASLAVVGGVHSAKRRSSQTPATGSSGTPGPIAGSVRLLPDAGPASRLPLGREKGLAQPGWKERNVRIERRFVDSDSGAHTRTN